MSKHLPDLSLFPDSEAKRKAENLAQELDILLGDLGGKNLSESEYDKVHREANKVWWEMNAQVGKVFEQNRIESSSKNQFYWSIAISIVALIVSVISLCI